MSSTFTAAVAREVPSSARLCVMSNTLPWRANRVCLGARPGVLGVEQQAVVVEHDRVEHGPGSWPTPARPARKQEAHQRIHLGGAHALREVARHDRRPAWATGSSPRATRRVWLASACIEIGADLARGAGRGQAVAAAAAHAREHRGALALEAARAGRRAARRRVGGEHHRGERQQRPPASPAAIAFTCVAAPSTKPPSAGRGRREQRQQEVRPLVRRRPRPPPRCPPICTGG